MKQDAEYRTYLEKCYRDVIVIDEADNVAARGTDNASLSMRHRLAELLKHRSDTLIMLSATPHDGKPKAFASLMNMLNPTAIANLCSFERFDKITPPLPDYVRFFPGHVSDDYFWFSLFHELAHVRLHLRRVEDCFSINRIPWMPNFGKFSRTPVFLTTKRGTRVDPLLSSDRSRATWYEDWLRKCFGPTCSQISDYRDQIFTLVIQELLKNGILEEQQVKGFPVWGMNPGRLHVTNQGEYLKRFAYGADDYEHSLKYRMKVCCPTTLSRKRGLFYSLSSTKRSQNPTREVSTKLTSMNMSALPSRQYLSWPRIVIFMPKEERSRSIRSI